jgi:hypothetical protein
MDATPWEQLLVAVATYLAGELTVLLFAGDVTWTPAWLVAVISIETKVAPPQ